MIRMRLMGLAAALALAGCATVPAERGPVEVQLIALNDFHGNLEPPKSAIDYPGPGPNAVQVPAGGAAYLASAVASLRARSPHTMVVAAGDLIGASPLVSALFLDEPSVAALNLIGLDYTAVGNHEFDRGSAELLRMQKGGCAVYTSRKPCALEPFAGARFGYLAANVETAGGGTLFPAYAIRSFGEGARQVKVAVIGMPLKETPTMVAGTATAGLHFRDEAETVNALIPRLKAEGADAIVVLIHQGVNNKLGYNDQSCALTGDLLPILERLDPAVDVVVSGHTHEAYVCDYSRINASRNFLLTSAGRYGTLLTDITLSIDPVAGRVVAKHADNIIVQGEAFRGAKGDVPLSNAVPAYPADARIASLVARYAAAAGPVAARPVGRLAGPALRTVDSNHESVLGNLIADAQRSAGRAAGAQVALMNSGGMRADLVPGDGGSLGFGQLFAAQPFANTVVVKSLTGKQLRAVLEQQFASGSNTAEAPNVLSPSQGLRFAYDLSKPAGQRIVLLTIGGAPVTDDAVYRVATNSFLAGGGDNFTVFGEGTDSATVGSDLDALEAYIAAASTLPLPALGRVENRTPG
ncbi:MAG: bifunctional metallophosphatase/5'-nucleotidase [Alphaproteobacteria bacterium]|nr:MAG: bifunctional metallophosphatase/5'-nucleotidase [Alphaproteobacteria bacterium]